MSDIYSKNRQLFIMRYEHQKMVALSQIKAREIRIIELEEEIERNKVDIAAQHKVIEEMDSNIKDQMTEIQKEAEINKEGKD